MTTPILTTKLYIPPPNPTLVRRSHLVEHLNQGVTRKLTIISAPAGFGKTTLLSEWFQQGSPTIAWLSLDESDNDLAIFLIYLITALQQIDPNIGRDILTTLQTSSMPPPETLLVMLINNIAGAGQEFILVLDDYHVIKEAAVHDALNFMLNHFPTGMHLVIAGRTDPPLQLSRMRVRDEITEIRTDDLRFTLTEAETFFNNLLDLDLSPADIAALDSRTEGWIASLQLAALSLQDRADKHEFVEAFSGSHRYVIDYLVEEVMAHQPDEIQEFLRQTSILDRFCAPLCDATLQISTSRQTLQQLETTNLFLIPLDDNRHWYRYHHLFADFLQQQLRLQDSTSIADLHRRAAQWYETEGLVNEAIHHFLAATDYSQVVRLLEEHSMPTILQGHVRSVEGWLKALPPDRQTTGPRTSLAFAWMLLLRGQYDEVGPHLENVETLTVQQTGIDFADIQCEVLALRAVLTSLQVDPLKGIELAQQAVNLAPADNTYLQGLVYFSLGTTYNYAGQIGPAMTAYQQAIPLCQAAGNRVATVLCSTNLTMLAYTRGQLHLAANVCQQVLDAMADYRSPALGAVYSSLGIIHYEWNQLDKAHNYLQQGLTWGRLVGHPAALSFCLVNLSRVFQAQGKIKEAASALQEAVDFLKEGTPAWVTPEVVGRQVEFVLAQGNAEVATTFLEQSGVRPEDEANYAIEVLQITHLRWLVAAGREAQGLELSRRLQESAEAGERTGRVIQILVQRALLHQAQNDTGQALDILNQALVLAEPEGYIRTFVDAGQPIAELLQRMMPSFAGVEGGGMKKYVVELLNTFETTEVLHLSSFSPQPLIEPLSDRELEVLQLMADGLSNPEIAERLVITPGTVKVHVHNIYGKLGVSGRVKAVAKARELSLL